MSEETIKAICPKCQAKYRLPTEAQGRVARCKRCGDKFEVPRKLSLEDSVLTWLTGPVEIEEETEAEAPAQPKVINMPQQAEAEAAAQRSRGGVIRMKPGTGAPVPKTGS